MEVINRSRDWIDKQINKLRKQGVALTYARIQKESSSKMISSLGLNSNEEEQLQEKGKG